MTYIENSCREQGRFNTDHPSQVAIENREFLRGPGCTNILYYDSNDVLWLSHDASKFPWERETTADAGYVIEVVGTVVSDEKIHV